MKIINKSNFWNVYCKTFTCVSLGGTCLDIAGHGSINYSQFNILMIAIGCLIGILILSQSYYIDAFSPLAVMVLQYAAAIVCVLLLTWLTGFWEPVSPHGYRDMLVSFSVVYFIGAVIYYKRLKQAIKNQNEVLQYIKNQKITK